MKKGVKIKNMSDQKIKSYKQAKDEFFKLYETQKGQIKNAINNMIEALQAEKKSQDECRLQLQKDLKKVVDRSYISKLVKSAYMTKEERLAEAAKLSEKEKELEAKVPLLVSSDGSTHIVPPEEMEDVADNTVDSETGNNPEQDIYTQRQAAKQGQSYKSVQAASRQTLKSGQEKSVTANTSDLDSDDGSDSVKELELYGNILKIEESKHLDQMKKIIEMGKSVVVIFDGNLHVEKIMAGNLSH